MRTVMMQPAVAAAWMMIMTMGVTPWTWSDTWRAKSLHVAQPMSLFGPIHHPSQQHAAGAIAGARLARQRRMILQSAAGASEDDPKSENAAAAVQPPTQDGAYKSVHDRIWQRIESAPLLQLSAVQASGGDGDDLLQTRQSPARGFPEGTVVQLSVQAKTSSVTQDGSESESPVRPIRYIRSALLETIMTESNDGSGSGSGNDVDNNSLPTSTQGIQVLNFVIFPSADTDLPVWGADLVSLPGNKHLWLLDAQPMIPPQSAEATTEDGSTDDASSRTQAYEGAYAAWYEQFVQADGQESPSTTDAFPWGGDLPPQVQPYVSRYALWARHTADTAVDVPDIVATTLEDAVMAHLDLYLQQVSDYDASSATTNHQKEYVQYRKANDPAKPMLKALYGAPYTDDLLEEVLFPSI